jgi:hypothetical protein
MVRSCSKVISNSKHPIWCFLTKENVVTVGTRMGDAIDLGALQQLNYFEGIELTDDVHARYFE